MKTARTKLAGGTVHPLPADFAAAISANPKVHALWEDITPLARNEWICWVTSGKLAETRDIRINKGISKMKGGMRRPCCWAGCMHRSDKPLSRSQKFVQKRTAGTTK
jgi:Bacteriocin-protection, YdeI or OmpD-Associated